MKPVSSPQQVNSDGREAVEEEGCELVQAMEHQAVPPDDQGEHQGSHAEDIVGLRFEDLILIISDFHLTLNQAMLDISRKICAANEKFMK